MSGIKLLHLNNSNPKQACPDGMGRAGYYRVFLDSGQIEVDSGQIEVQQNLPLAEAESGTCDSGSQAA